MARYLPGLAFTWTDGAALIDHIEPVGPTEVTSTSSVFNGVWLSTRVTPAQHAAAGGDWCETFVLSEDIIALSIGDICGHGPEQFAAMVIIRQAVRDAAVRGLDPAQTLAETNRFVCDLDPQLHATASFALLDIRRGMVTFANAGHPPPLMVGPSGSRFLTYPVSDLPLGIETVLLPALRVASAPAQTLLVLYTDGVTEHERQPLRGEAQLRNAATLAYRDSAFPNAFAIEERMSLTGSNQDDASILTAWMPRAARSKCRRYKPAAPSSLRATYRDSRRLQIDVPPAPIASAVHAE
ncbi:MAG: PP2C family protein-serine/threonine phosphatase [Vulcanimicrobiaceae bacterium]